MMNELAKSLLSFSWGLTLFGVQQVVNLITPQSPSQPVHKAATAFNAVTQATQEQLSDSLAAAFKAGDNMQKGVSDMTLNFVAFEGFNPSQIMRRTSDMMKQSSEALRQSQ